MWVQCTRTGAPVPLKSIFCRSHMCEHISVSRFDTVPFWVISTVRIGVSNRHNTRHPFISHFIFYHIIVLNTIKTNILFRIFIAPRNWIKYFISKVQCNICSLCSGGVFPLNSGETLHKLFLSFSVLHFKITLSFCLHVAVHQGLSMNTVV